MNDSQYQNNRQTSAEPSEGSLPNRTLLESILRKAGEGILSFAKFSGLVITTNIADMEKGFLEGGELEVKPHDLDVSSSKPIPGWQLQNAIFSCIYWRSTVTHLGEEEVRETLHMIRKDLPGGVIVQFTDGHPVSAITNAVPRVFLHPEEIEISERMLRNVRQFLS